MMGGQGQEDIKLTTARVPSGLVHETSSLQLYPAIVSPFLLEIEAPWPDAVGDRGKRHDPSKVSLTRMPAKPPLVEDG